MDALSAASMGGTGGYQFYEPRRIPPSIGAPRAAPLSVRLFGPQNGFESGAIWTLLGLLNTANPNRNFSPHNGWIGTPPVPPGPRSSAPTTLPVLAQAGNNAPRFSFTTSIANETRNDGGGSVGVSR